MVIATGPEDEDERTRNSANGTHGNLPRLHRRAIVHGSASALSGHGGVNRYRGSYTVEGDRLVAGPVIATTYRARMAMFPGAEVVVTIEDTARADAAAITVAQHVVRDPGEVPVAFQLTVDRSAVAPHARLGLRARIDVGGQLRWITDTYHPVDLDAEPQPHELTVQQVRDEHADRRG